MILCFPLIFNIEALTYGHNKFTINAEKVLCHKTNGKMQHHLSKIPNNVAEIFVLQKDKFKLKAIFIIIILQKHYFLLFFAFSLVSKFFISLDFILVFCREKGCQIISIYDGKG
jgi:hypothetical protein